MLLNTLISFSVFLVLFLAGKKNQPSEIRQFDILLSLPFLELKENVQENNIKTISDSFSIFYNNNFILYRFPYTFIEQHNDKPVNIEIRFTYFIFKFGSAHGYSYDPAKNDSIKTLNVDSILYKQGLGRTDIMLDSGYQITEVISKLDNFILTEKYSSISKPSRYFPDTVVYSYTDQFRDLPFSFSKKLEERKKLKILKIKGVYNSRFDDEYKTVLPKREFYFEIKPQYAIKDKFVFYVFGLHDKTIVNDRNDSIAIR